MPLLLPVLTGLLLAASFPKCGQHYLAWIAFIPLIAYVHLARSPARAFRGGCLAGGVELFVLLVWMPEVLHLYGGLDPWLAWTGYALLVLLLSSFSGAACLATKALMLRGGDCCILLFPAVWVLVEFLQTAIPFGGFPWLATGYTQTENLALIQMADVTGVFGVSFLVVWFPAAALFAGLHRGRGMRAWWPILAAAALLAVGLGYGRARLARWAGVRPDHTAVMLQANLRADASPGALREAYPAGYVRMLDSAPPSRIDLLILPESPTPVFYQQDETLRQTVSELARRATFGLVFNNIRIGDADGGMRSYNSAYFLDAGGGLTGVYDKIHLVPFGEYIPMKGLFVFMRTITQDVGEFDRGNVYALPRVGGERVNATICFEAIFPGLVRRFVRDGSRLIVNLTNDGWYGRSSAPFQHFNIARWRAVENRRYFLRSANTGISAVIEPTGRVQTATGILERAVCEGRFAFVAQQTFYTRYGDVFVWLCAMIVFGCAVPAYAKGRGRPMSHP